MSRIINKTQHSAWFTASELYAISPTKAGWRWLPTGQRVHLPLSPTQLRIGSISIQGSVTISHEAEIGHNVIVGHNTKIGPRVSVGDRCVIYNDVRIETDVTIGHDCVINMETTIKACARIGAGTAILDNCTIGFDAQIGDEIYMASRVIVGMGVKLLPNQTIDQHEQIPTTPLQIQGSRDVVRSGANGVIHIGCSFYTRENWKTWYNERPEDRRDLGYTPQQIDEYRRHLDYVASYTTPTRPEPQDPESECA